jgi:Protein of unknown function (DUF3131)
MTFTEGLIRARGHVVFLLGLATAFSIAIALERSRVQAVPSPATAPIEVSALPSLAPPAPLTAEELGRARLAWKYFENNLRPETGLVDSVDRYPASTMWDTASYLMALLAARRLELIPEEVFDARIAAALGALERLPLFAGKLPNKSYNTQSLAMVDYNNQPTTQGIGWSAIDVGRLLVPMNILTWHHPRHTPQVRSVLARWDLSALVRDGRLFGAAVQPGGEVEHQQEGRLGYEEYAAKSLQLLGYDVSDAMQYLDFVSWTEIDGARVATDSRVPEIYVAHNYVVSEPYILDGLEFGGDRTSRELAGRVYRAQEGRFRRSGVLTAVSEDNLDRPPYFVYNTVFSDGKVWNTLTDTGADASAFRSLSVKAAFGWDALYRTPYTARLVAAVQSLHDPQRGWYSGRYEADGQPNKAITCNTNAIILESLAYRQAGPLVTGRAALGTP